MTNANLPYNTSGKSSAALTNKLSISSFVLAYMLIYIPNCQNQLNMSKQQIVSLSCWHLKFTFSGSCCWLANVPGKLGLWCPLPILGNLYLRCVYKFGKPKKLLISLSYANSHIYNLPFKMRQKSRCPCRSLVWTIWPRYPDISNTCCTFHKLAQMLYSPIGHNVSQLASSPCWWMLTEKYLL